MAETPESVSTPADSLCCENSNRLSAGRLASRKVTVYRISVEHRLFAATGASQYEVAIDHSNLVDALVNAKAER